MLTQEQIDEGLRLLDPRTHRYAFIWHHADRIVQVDEGTGDVVCTGIKGLHLHLVLWIADHPDGSDQRPTIRTISDAFQIPSAHVRVPKEIAAQEGLMEHRGRNAAEKSFWDHAEYLTHESRRGNAVRGIAMTDRRYLVDSSQEGQPGKYQYGRGQVVANFDFSRELDLHMVGRVSAADGSTSLRARKIKLRRAVMDGLPLVEARELDRDAYADDLPRLRELAKEYTELQGAAVALQIGSIWRKTFIVATGATRQGKDTFLTELSTQLIWLASLAGLEWSCVKPAGKNSLEGIGRAELVHHEDMRFRLVPGYDEGLRYFDPNQATEAATRFKNTSAPTPRVIMASSSETLLSLGYTLKRRASSEYLAELQAGQKTASQYPLDIDEFLYRIGWYIEVRKPEGVGDDIDAIREGMIVSIFRVQEGQTSRVETVLSRGGDRLGEVRTRHEMDQVALIRGCENAARFLAVSIIQERNPDVAEAIPQERLTELVAANSAIEDDARDRAKQERENQRAADEEAERQQQERLVEERRQRMSRFVDEQRQRALCTCETYTYYHRHHDDNCLVLPEAERLRRAETRQQNLDRKVELLRANGGLLISDGTS